MKTISLFLAVGIAAALPAAAQAPSGTVGGSSSSAPLGNASMGALLRDGYEIKASSPTGNRFVVFLQKGQSAYACEFVTLSNSRCGEIE